MNQQTQQPQTQQQAKRENPLVAFKAQLDQRVSQFALALPAHIPPERFSRVVLTAVQNNPDLLGAERQSMWNSCMRAAQDGLLPDGRDGAIVIFNTKEKYKKEGSDATYERTVAKAQWMPMVGGIQKKARNSGELTAITAKVVYDADKYRYWIDEAGEHLLYEPAINPDTSKIRLVFAMARTKSGELFVEPMSVADVEKVRSVSRAKDGPAWNVWWGEMAKKTAIRRLSKRLPMSSDLDDLVRRDDDLYDLDNKQLPTAEVLDLDQLPAPAATQVPQSPGEQAPLAAGVSGGADASRADGSETRDGASPPDNSNADLEQSIAGHLLDCKTLLDCDGVIGLFRDELTGQSAAFVAGVYMMIDQRKAAIKAAAADDDFPGDRP